MFIKSHPILSRFLLWVVLPIILILSLAYGFLLQSLPQVDGVVRLKGLDFPVTIIRDEHAIPHISAATDHDAFFALGYLHAQDRIWQMNYLRRLSQGRLSEILGRESLASDQFMRTLGLSRSAQTALQSLDDSARQVLTAYANGVNAWIKEENILPIEFYILNTEPELWQPSDSLLLTKIMAFNLGNINYGFEMTFDSLVRELGLAKANEIFPDPNSKTFPVTEAAGLVDEGILQGLLAQRDGLQIRFDLSDKGLGSNAWAVSGKFTKSGLPLLGNDPHLGIGIPTMFYLAEIQGNRLHVAGATFPGIPLVTAGRNKSIAWGTTNMIADVQDLYVERVNPLNEYQYEVDGQWLDMEVDEELIHIKSDFPVFLTDPIPPLKWLVRRTKHGPLISDAIGRVEHPLALRWTGLDESDKSYQSYLSINYAEDWTSFKSSFEGYVVPASNFIYADIHGDIGLFAAGKIPIRDHSNGRLPVPGWQSIYDWDRYIPLDSVTQILNPEKGYIANSNNKIHPDDYPYMISHLWADPYRFESISQTIESHIKTGRKLTVQDFVDLQGSTRSLQVDELLPFLQNLAPETPKQRDAIGKLIEWDGDPSDDSKEAVIYMVWLRHFRTLLIGDELRGSVLHEARADILQFVTTIRMPKFIKRVISHSENLQFNWCDRIGTDAQETCEELALDALDEALNEIDRKIGADMPWGDVLEVHYGHQVFANTPLLDFVFDRTTGKGGDRYSVNSVNWSYSEDNGYRVDTTANYRQVVDFNDWSQGGFINDTGQSGNLLSEHYDDHIQPFKELKLWPMQFAAGQNSEKLRTLTLEPIN
ncbi:MAG: penicillin amidase [Arenicella sp.]|jgi:penicillin amidase